MEKEWGKIDVVITQSDSRRLVRNGPIRQTSEMLIRDERKYTSFISLVTSRTK